MRPIIEKLDNNQERGFIHLITGPMFSGKTTEMLRILNRYSLAEKSIIVLKHQMDKDIRLIMFIHTIHTK